MRISVVVPVFEDRAELLQTLGEVGSEHELIVVDASREDPVRMGDLPSEARLIRAGRADRAWQMNLGAGLATGEILLFLHADTRLPTGASGLISSTLDDPAVMGGGFERRFDSDSSFLRWSCGAAGWRSRKFGWFLGDQAIFVRRSAFERIGGYRALRIFEDVDLCRRLKGGGILRCVSPPVVSSARRFKGGAVRRTVRDLGLTVAYLALGTRPFRSIQSVK